LAEKLHLVSEEARGGAAWQVTAVFFGLSIFPYLRV
jgi:hypothetical protein